MPFKHLLSIFMLITAVLANPVHAEQNRLISTDSGVTELIFALGLEEDLIAVDVTSTLPDDFPELPNIGYHRRLSAEGLMSMEPTTVIGSQHMGPEPVINALKQAKVNLVQLPSAKTKEQLRDNILNLATALNKQERGSALLKTVDNQLAKLEQTNLSGEKVAFVLSMDDNKLRLAGKQTGGHSFIELMAADNVADFDNYRNVSAESLLAMQPTAIIVAGRDAETAVEKLMKANPILAHTPAGKRDTIVAVDGSSLVAGLSVSAIQEAIRLSKAIHNSTNTERQLNKK